MSIYVFSGEPQETEELSKQSAALKACKRLRAAGELDDFLFHTGKEAEKYRLETDPFPVIKDFQKQKNKTPGPEGGPKRRQLYHRYIPKCFRQRLKGAEDPASGLPQPEKPCYVYRISMYFRQGIQEKYNYRGRRLHRPEDFSRFVTSKFQDFIFLDLLESFLANQYLIRCPHFLFSIDLAKKAFK